mgnify:FL=1
MENWYDDPKIMDEASQEWFDKPQIVSELQLDPDMIRQDLTMKSNQGFLGQIKDNKGRKMTEQSIDVDLDMFGEKTKVHMPLLVPGLTNEEIASIKEDKPLDSAYKKAVEHGKKRLLKGKSPFFQEGEDINEKYFFTDDRNIVLESDEVPIVANQTSKDVKETPDMRLNRINNYLEQKGYSKEARAGIIGNIKQESGAGENSYNFNVQQENGGGYGIFQLDFMKPYYKKYLEEKDKTDSIESQIDYMDDVINNRVNMLKPEDAKKLKKGLANAKTPEEAAKIFMEIFEKPGKPHLKNRIDYANEYYESN